MAENTTPAAAPGKTEYRILRKLTPEELTAGTSAADEQTAEQLAEDAEIYVLLPDTYTGNVKRAVFDKLGEGDYIKVSSRSLDPFSARKKEVVTFK